MDAQGIGFKSAYSARRGMTRTLERRDVSTASYRYSAHSEDAAA
jgi:hypothetical protein